MGVTVHQLSSHAQQACLNHISITAELQAHTRAQKLRTKEGKVDEGKVVEEQEPEEFACTAHASESGR